MFNAKETKNVTGEVWTRFSRLVKNWTIAITLFVTWRKNVFLIPRGNASKKFISALKGLINLFNNNNITKEVALKAVIVLMPIMLQKPARK